MARTKDQSFVNRYLNQYQQNQKSAVSAGQQAASNAASSGVQQMNATGNIKLPSLYDPTEDLYGFVLDQQEAQLKAQQAAAKAAQKAAKEAENAREQMIKDNIQNMRDVAKMNRDKKKRVQKIADNMASSETATLASAKKKTGILPNVLPGLTEASPYVSPYDSLGRPNLIGDGKFVPVLQKVEGRTMEYTGVPARSLAKTAAVERAASAYDAMTASEKLAAAQNLSAQSQVLQNQIDALEGQKIEPKMGAGAYDEEAYAIVQKNRQIVEQQEALEAQRKQVNDQISEVSDALWNDSEYAASIQTEIDAKPESQRIEQYLDPSYKLNRMEEKDAKEIADRLIKEAYDLPRNATQEQLSDAFDKEILGKRLIDKTSNAAAVSAGVASAIPFAEEADRALTNWMLGEDADKYSSELPSLGNFIKGAKTQSPIAYTAGNVGGNLALYSVGSSAARSIPALQRVGQAAAATPAAQALQKVPVLGRLGTADAITGIYGDTLVDLALDTVPNLGNDIAAYNRQRELIDQGRAEGKTLDDMIPVLEEYQGEYLTPGGIAADTLKGIGTNLAFNLGGELVPELLKVGGQKLRNEFASIPSLDDGAQTAARVVGNTDVPSIDDTAQAVRGGIDDVVSAWRSGTLTNAQLETLKPGGVNRAAFEQATGVKLPDTSSDTRKFLRSIDNQQAQVYDEVNNMVQGGALNERTGENAVRGMAEDALPVGQGMGTADGGRGKASGGDSVLRQFLTPSENINAAVERTGATPLELVDTTGNPQFFSFALEQARQTNPNGLMVSGKTVEELSQPGTVTFMSKDGLAGALVTADGDIEAVFKNPRSSARGAGSSLLMSSINNGGNKLDCYGDGLVNLYAKHGFEPVARVPWNPEYAPDGWTYGPKDVYVMKLAGGLDADGVAARLGLSESDGGFHRWTQEELNALPTMDYDQALAYRDSLIEADKQSARAAQSGIAESFGAASPSLSDGLPESIGAMHHNPRSYAGMQVEYGTIAPGENAARVVDVPISTDGTDRVSASARTFMEAPQTTDELVGMFEKGVEDGLFSHDVKRDADSLARAVSAVEQDGYQNILTSWKNLMRTGAPLNKEQIVQGQLLYTLAAKNGDTATAMELAGDLARIATESGQNLQAQRLLKRMTPEGKLYYAQQTVDSFNRQLKQQLGDGFQDIKIPEELARPLMEAKDAKAQNDAMQNIYQYVADQLPADWGTRWNAWRYLAMLSNPATHVRNVLSNVVNVPARKFKNILGAGIERLTLEEGQRTKSIINPLSASDRSLVEFAKNDIENVMPQLTGAQKYSDRSAIKQMVDPFKVNGTWGKNADSNILAKGARSAADAVSGSLSSAYKFNSWALGAEDMLFKKGAYVDSLSQYLKANGIDPAKATQKQLDAAREYAVEEALRATYTEFNSMAQALGKVERKNLVTKVFFGGVVPFKSTPFNIIRRGVRYSPVGLMESVTNGVRMLRAGEINANQFIDNISQGLSGTAIFGLGMWLGANGIINGISPENKKEQSLKSSQGWQNYSINLPGGGTYTIDWGGPSVMAILAGVETAKAFEKDGYDFNEVLTALGNITEPMFDTTMLDGVNSAIQSATYAGSNPVTALVSQAASNFVTQAVPSLSGVVARAYDPVRRTAYSDQEGAFGTIVESKQRIMNKVPGLSESNQPYIDVWGREQENPGGSFVGRLAYGLLSPGHYSPDRSTIADSVVEGLYETTGDSGTLPGSFNSSVTVDGEKIKLSPENYTLAKQTKGQASKQMIESLYEYPRYNAMDAEMQADVVKGVYDLANDVAKYQVIPSLYDGLVSEIESGDASKSETLAAMYLTGGAEQVIPYLVADELTSDVRADKNAKGNSIPGSREKNFIETLMQNGYTRGDAEALYQMLK
ncbi:hypothetical protein [Candidatus Allofournierella merdipullorum]|uniref:hypothetical protein n=1 Tax=Candidatus Allofournierella merdipullorum TaxID=2838595 RepID=UPI002A870098|nr:hypothetical protein [Candidatus Fournierella merdipullorum]